MTTDSTTVDALTREVSRLAARNAVLEDEVGSLRKALAATREMLGSVQKRLTRLTARYERAKESLAWFRRQVFGPKSERRLVEPPAEQGNLFEGLGFEALPPQPAAEEFVQVPGHQRRKKRRLGVNEKGLRFDEDVPVETIHVRDPAIEAIPESERELVDEHVTHRLAQTEASYRILRYVRPVWKHKETGAMLSPPAPENVLESTQTDVSFLSGLLTEKFLWHMPLHRQHQKLALSGIHVSRSSLTTWTRRAISLLEPIYEAQRSSVLSSAVLLMDETPIKAGRKSKGKMRTGYYWPILGERDEIVFPYAPTRAESAVQALLGDFSGTLVTDGYDVYAKWTGKCGREVPHGLCWSHARRNFEHARRSDRTWSAIFLEVIGRLFEQEQEIKTRELSGCDKLDWRERHSKPIASEFWKLCDRIVADPSRLPQDQILKAVAYAQKRRRGLDLFLSDPAVPLDTNAIERAIRVIALGRKNWLFCWTEIGARQTGMIQSLLATCRMQNLSPHVWLVDVLQRVATHPQRDVALLTPRLWKERFADEPMTSDVGTGELRRGLSRAT